MPKALELSVIIPTYKRAQILRHCLDALEKQTVRDHIEVIVVSDGPDEKTADMFLGLSWSFPIKHFAIPKAQQGVARNRAVEKASGKFVLLIGDDILLAPDACEVHLHTHTNLQNPHRSSQTKSEARSPKSEVPVAILGFTTWDPAVGITPVMRWLEETGWQFGYRKIAPFAHQFLPEKMQHRFTYTSHLSLPIRVLRRIPFREDIMLYGWEDIEWGMRLRDRGIRLLYEPDARAFHHHHVEFADSLARMETLGRSVIHVSRLNLALDRRPRGWKLLLYHLLACVPGMRGTHTRAFLRGIRAARRSS